MTIISNLDPNRLADLKIRAGEKAASALHYFISMALTAFLGL